MSFRAAVLALALLAVPAIAGDPTVPPAIPEADLQAGPGGLRFAELRAGDGPTARVGDVVDIRIRLWTEAGAPVLVMKPDDAPFQVPLGAGSLIPGLDAGIPGMQAGGERWLLIPVELAYGASPPEGVPGGPLRAAVELVAVQAAARPAPGPTASGRKPPEQPPIVERWTVLESGVEIGDIAVGDGEPVAYDRPIHVEYTGWTVEGLSRFDSSYARSAPFRVQLGSRSSDKVIPGWEVALRDMRVGGHRLVKIPAYLAYGSYGQGSIPAHSDLLFEIEVVRMD
jgi:FKBP-type peptidyl-prolyl cis-trans isomerase